MQALEAMNSAFCRHVYSTALEFLQQQYSADAVAQQFMEIVEQDDPYDRPCTVAHQDVNCSKNRYRDVVPYDHNRVMLPSAHSSGCPAGISAYNSSSSSNSRLVVAPTVGSGLPPGDAASVPNSGSSCNVSGNADDTYVNASFMSDPWQEGDALSYIGTQGPLPSTVSDFWRMVAATNTSAVVMLTSLTDGCPTLGNSRPRCAPYFPDKEQDVLRLQDGITITCVHQNNLDENVFFRQLEVRYPCGSSCLGGAGSSAAGTGTSTNSSSRLQQQHQHSQQQQSQPHQQQQQQSASVPPVQQPLRLWINHYQYAAWPDYGVPSSTASALALSHALEGCRRTGCNIVVHCSAGVGRTGTFIAIDSLLHRLHNLTLQLHGTVTDDVIRAAMDIPTFVASLRKLRRGTVQTGEQYAFIWHAVMDELVMLVQERQQLQQEQLYLQHEQHLQLGPLGDVEQHT
jgi:tyrosine-protein phosphatase non-receptor type 9